jgi:hypothetical protein
MKRSAISPDANLKRALVAALVSAAFFWTLTLSFSPQLHVRIHCDAQQSQHECGVTLIAGGKFSHAFAAPLVSAPVPSACFSAVQILDPQWVQSLFLGSSIFEHAPPALA